MVWREGSLGGSECAGMSVNPRNRAPGALPRVEADLPTGWQTISSWAREHRCRGADALLLLELVTRSLRGRADSETDLAEDGLSLSASQSLPISGSQPPSLGPWREPRPGKAGRLQAQDHSSALWEGICSAPPVRALIGCCPPARDGVILLVSKDSSLVGMGWG